MNQRLAARPDLLVPACGQLARLPRPLVSVALSHAAPGSASVLDVERQLRCLLQEHQGDHHALVLQLDGSVTTAVWTSWADDQVPEAVEVRDDCTAVSSPGRGSQPCCEYAEHPGAHTFDVEDPAVLEVL